MMRKILIAASLAASVPAWADSPSPQMKMHLSNIGRQPPFSAMWIDAIPQIAELCDLKVNKAQMFNVTNTFRGGEEINNDLRMLRAKPDMNIILQDISDLDVNGKANESCAAANALWGEDGTQFPGVLVAQ